MEFVTTPADLQQIARAASKLDANPVRLAGRVLGLGADEQRAGVPTWAWLALVGAVGVGLGVAFAPKIRGWLALD